MSHPFLLTPAASGDARDMSHSLLLSPDFCLLSPREVPAT
jgi:hypothetical protein